MDWVQIIAWKAVVFPADSKKQLRPHFVACSKECVDAWAAAQGVTEACYSLGSVPAKAREHCAHCIYCGLLLWGTKGECDEHDEAGCPPRLFLATATAQGFAQKWPAAQVDATGAIPDRAWEIAERLWKAGEWRSAPLVVRTRLLLGKCN